VNTFTVLLSKQRPTSIVLSAVGPQGPSGASTVEGDLSDIDSITFRHDGHTYRMRVVGEDGFGNPIVQWVKVT